MVQAISYGCHLHRPDNFLLTVASLGGSLRNFELCQMGCCTFKSVPANAGQNGTGTQTNKNPQSGTDTIPCNLEIQRTSEITHLSCS